MLVEIFGYTLIFISGAFVGSFLNVVTDRLQSGESIFFGRSHCDSCDKSLGSRDLFPLLSFIFLGGKCRYCADRLSYYYPFSELLTGAAFLGIAYFLNIFEMPHPLIWVSFAYLVILASFYIVIFLSDMKFRIIPNRVVYPAIVFVTIFVLFNLTYGAYASYSGLKNDDFGKYLIESGFWWNQVFSFIKSLGWTYLSAFGIGFFFWFLIFITKGRGMGGGDVKLGFLIGIVNAFPLNIVAIFLGFMLGAVLGISSVVLKKKGLKDTIPFGPFLIIGSVIAFVYGQLILDWYLQLL